MSGLFSLLFLASVVLLVFGLIKPETLRKFNNNRPLTRKNIGWIFGTLIVVALVGIGMASSSEYEKSNLPANKTKPVAEGRPTSTTKVEQQKATQSTMVSQQPSATSVQGVPPAPIKQRESSEESLYLVTKVVDGDTFDVVIRGETKRIRLIGVDTPETVDPRKPVQCFGKEASQKAKELLLNKKVKLEADPTQGELDKYGRLLRYTTREDGLFYNKWIIQNGYAHEYTYNLPYKYQEEFKTAEKHARENKLGLWADNACQTAPAATEEPKTDPTPQPIPVTTAPAPEQPKEPSENCTIKGNISSDKRKIYHLPTCASYSKTVINELDGERWFCSEQEAVNAGWVKAGNC